MGKSTNIYNMWRLFEYSVFCLLCLRTITFLQRSFLASKVLVSRKGIGRQIDTQTWSLTSHSGGSALKLLAFAFRTKSCCIQEMKKKKRDMKAKSVCCRGQSENRILTENKKNFTSF